jgi:transposase
MYNLNQSLFIGCDISSDKNVVSLLLQDGTSVSKNSFNNDLEGTQELIELIYSNIKEYQCSSFLLGVEATSNYQSHLLRSIAVSKLNTEFEMHLFQFNARIIREFKKIYSPKSKTDPYDALIIAERLRFGNLPDEFIPFDKLEPLRRLTRSRFHIVKMIEKESNYFLSNLFIKISNYKKLPFSNTFGNTSIALITEFDIQDIEEMPIESLIDFLILN